MGKTLQIYILLWLFTLPAALAQTAIPNLDFEQWHTVPNTFGGLDPDGYRSNNAATAGANRKGINRSTDAYSGQYALELSPLISQNSSQRLESQVCVGFPALNYSTYQLNMLNGGFNDPQITPIDSIKGYYKYIPDQAGDSAYAFLKIQWVDPMGPGLTGLAIYYFTPSSTYVPFSIPVPQYTFSQSPPVYRDSVAIAFFYRSNNTSFSPTGKLLIDSLSISPSSTITAIRHETSLEESITIWPNPAIEQMTYNLEGQEQSYEVRLLSLQGKELMRTNSVGTGTIVISKYAAGVYLLEFKDQQTGEAVYRKVIKE